MARILKAAAVVRYSGIADAAAKLYILSGNQSPILVLLCEVSRNTSVDSSAIQKAFQPVQQVSASGCQDQYKQPSNANYLIALLQLEGCLDQIKNTPAELQDAAKANCVTTAAQAKTATLRNRAGIQSGLGRPCRSHRSVAHGGTDHLGGRAAPSRRAYCW